MQVICNFLPVVQYDYCHIVAMSSKFDPDLE